MGELTVAPAAVGSVRGEGVDDGEAPGSSGASWGGSNRRRASAVVTGSEVAIGELRRVIGAVRWSRSLREERGVCWCAQIDEWGLLFIGEQVTVVLRRTRHGRGVSGGLAS